MSGNKKIIYPDSLLNFRTVQSITINQYSATEQPYNESQLVVEPM